MNADRRTFLRVAGSSVVVGAGSVLAAAAVAAQAPQPAPPSFPNVANPLEGSLEVVASGYIWTEGDDDGIPCAVRLPGRPDSGRTA